MTAQAERLLDAWLAPTGAGEPVGVIATTFTFDADFFEEECLARFLGLDVTVASDSSAADAAYYVVQREDALVEARAAVLVDRAQAMPATSHRWDVIPVSAPTGGVQHAKLTLLVWADVMRLIVTSANLTISGYRTNIEVLWRFDWPRDEALVHLFLDASDFLEAVIARHTAGDDSPDSPRGRAKTTIATARARLPRSAVHTPSRREPHLRLVHTLQPGDLLTQAFDGCWRGRASPDQATVVSPYYVSRGPTPGSPDGLTAVRGRLARRGPVACTVGLTALTLPPDTVRLDAPEEINHSRGRGRFSIGIWDRVPNETERVLHAKIMKWSRGDWTLILAGSANCTSAGLGLPGAPGNIEASIAIGADPARPGGKDLARWLAPLGRVPDGQLVWAQPMTEEDVPDTDTDRLPDKFREALFRPAADEVIVEVDPQSAPRRWSINHEGIAWFNSEHHGTSPRLRHALSGTPAPLTLSVEWSDDAGETHIAGMLVSVADRSKLPHHHLNWEKLNLEDLLELLAAGSRFRPALRKIIGRRGKPHPGWSPGATLTDPHARVDTSRFVLPRMRRAGLALEGLRERLELRVSHRDAVKQRLTGRYGPRELARQLEAAVDAGSLSEAERAFLIAELILTLKRTQWHPVSAELTAQWCHKQSLKLGRELTTGVRTADRDIAAYLDRARHAG